MYAVVEAGGRQYQLTSGRYIDVEMVSGEPESDFVFDRVLMIVDGEQSTFGAPLVKGAKVTGKIISHGRGPKLVVYKYRSKKGTRKRTGHRQGYTRIFIDAIRLDDKVLSEAKDQGKRTPAQKAAKPAPEAKKAVAEKPVKTAKAAATDKKGTKPAMKKSTTDKTTKKD